MFGIGGDRQIVSLDWDTQSLRAVLWQIAKRKAKARKLLTAPIPSDLAVKDPNVMGAFVRQALMKERIRVQSVIIDIPRDQTVLNTMSLPAVDLNDLAGMVQLQIAKELPFPLTDAVVDFAVLDHDGSSTTVDVLVAAIRSEALDFYRSVCEKAGLKLERVGLRPYANMVAINEMLGAQTRGRALFVDVGPTLTEIGILRDGALVFSRAASTHVVQDTAEPSETPATAPAPSESASSISIVRLPTELRPEAREAVVKGILVEITRSAEAFRSTDPGAIFDHIVVAGSTGLEADLAEAVSRRFLVKTQLYNPTPVLGAAKHRGVAVTGFAAAIGLGLGHAEEGRLHFDFLHPKKPLDAAARRRQKLPVVGAVAALLLLAGAGAYLVGIRPKQMEIQKLQVQIDQLEDQLEIYDQAAGIVKAANRWREEQLVWPDELKAVAEVMPPAQQGYLEYLKPKGSTGQLVFGYMAKERQVINQLVKTLNGLTREGDKEGEVKPLFKANAPSISDTDRNSKYESKTTMYVQSARILEVKDKYDRKGKRRRK